MGLAPQTFAQEEEDKVRLVLKDRISELGGYDTTEDPLSNAEIIVVHKADSSNGQPRRLEDEERELLADTVENDGHIDSTGVDGKTTRTYAKTEDTNKLYVLALIQDQLYESYVFVPEEGNYPGLDTVESGSMTMGPVPEEHLHMMRAAFDARNSRQENENRSTSENSDKARDQDGEGESSAWFSWLFSLWPAWLFTANVGFLLIGLLIGTLGGWWVVSKKLHQRENELKQIRWEVRDLQRRLEEKSGPSRDRDEGWIGADRELQRENEDLRQENRRLQEENKSAVNSADRDYSQSMQPHNPNKRTKRFRSNASSSRARSPTRPTLRTEDKVGREFVQWCSEAGAAMVDRHSIFAKRLQDVLPRVRLQRIFREKNAAGVVFTEDAQDAVEYWHVHVDGRDFLLPQPHRSGFRELEKCFDGQNPDPGQIQDMTPAELRSQGDKITLVKKGRIS